MASRNERRWAGERQYGQSIAPAPSHGERMMASVVKSAETQQVKQSDGFLDAGVERQGLDPALVMGRDGRLEQLHRS